jgi:hypothetical protein
MYQLTKAEKNEAVTVCDYLRRLRVSATLPNAFTDTAYGKHQEGVNGRQRDSAH